MIIPEIPDGAGRFDAAICTCFTDPGTIILLRKAPDHPIYPGLWGVPAGRYKEEDKDMFGTAVREVEEETGVFPERSDIHLFHVAPCCHSMPDGTVFYFNAYLFFLKKFLDVREIRLDPREHNGLRLLPIGNIYGQNERDFIPDFFPAWGMFERQVLSKGLM